MPPCLTPFVMKKLSDRADPHLTHAFWVVYHFMRILTKIRGIPLSISFFKIKSSQWFTLSNALDASIKHTYIDVDCDL